MPKYRVEIDGVGYDVESDEELSDEDAYQAAAQQHQSEGSGVGTGALLAGGAALAAGAGALALHRPDLLKAGYQNLSDLRRTSMLSGWAPLKSLLGNAGSSVYSSIERQSLAPLKEMFSPQTVQEAIDAFKKGSQFEGAGGSTSLVSKFNLPGRVMGALDTAAQNALQRAGLTPAESAREMLQAPLGKNSLIESMSNNPVADYLVPFRRTPFNQLSEGLASFKPSNLQTAGEKAALATALGTGFATGETVDDPKAIALGTAFSGRRGLPFAAGAAAGRYLRTGDKRSAQQPVLGMSPVSDYSLAEGFTKPLEDPLGSIIPKPAAISAYQSLRKMLGLD